MIHHLSICSNPSCCTLVIVLTKDRLPPFDHDRGREIVLTKIARSGSDNGQRQGDEEDRVTEGEKDHGADRSMKIIGDVSRPRLV